MKFNIYEYIEGRINDGATFSNRYENIHQVYTLPPRTTLLESGRISQNLYFVKKGCVRLWFNKDGKDITLQFFFDGQCVASIESFIQDTPSLFSIETIEPCIIWSYNKADILRLAEEIPGLKDSLQNLITRRLINYTHLFLSRIKDTPQQRYEHLLKEAPEIVRRVPQHYIASYLGITPVSLSRIRSRK